MWIAHTDVMYPNLVGVGLVLGHLHTQPFSSAFSQGDDSHQGFHCVPNRQALLWSTTLYASQFS